MGPSDDVTDVSRAVGVIELARPSIIECPDTRSVRADPRRRRPVRTCRFGRPSRLAESARSNFCTGADLKDAAAIARDHRATDDHLQVVQSTMRRLECSRLPVVAASQGLVLAGGLELACAVTWSWQLTTRSSATNTSTMGLAPAWGGGQRLPRAVGLQRALHLMLYGSRISADTAAQWGLVSHVVPAAELIDGSMRYCEKLATRSQSSLATMKRLARAADRHRLDVGLELERAAVLRRLDGPDAAEGLAAFEEGRVPLV